MTTAPTTIGAPRIREYRNGIRLSPEDIPGAFATLAGLCDPTYENSDWDAINNLAEAAQRAMSEGVATLPYLTTALLSKAVTGSFSAGRDAVNREFHARGGRNFLFEHNAGSQLPPFREVSIRIEPLTADHQMLKMQVTPIGAPKVFRGLERPIESQLAHDADLPMILGSVSINVPLQVTDQGCKYRFDMAPFADALRKHGCKPGKYMHFSETTGRAFADRFVQYYNRQTDNFAPTIQLVLDDGYSVVLGTHGCMFGTYDTWEQTRTTHYALNGSTEFSGPVSTQFESTELETPTVHLSVKGDALHLPERERHALNLAATLAASITSYHE